MQKEFYDKLNGRSVYSYMLTDGNIQVEICEMGARINAIRVKGTDIVLGFKTVADYCSSGTYAGATIGRVANRIADGRFTLNGRPYFLNVNNGANHLHGGNVGFDAKIFDVIVQTENSLVLQYVSEDGEERYPGKLTLTVKYTLANNGLEIRYCAVSNKDTLWNPTNHAYFNLDGEDCGTCTGNLLQINSCYYTPVDEVLIPTGEKSAVSGTVFDFTSLREIGEFIAAEELRSTRGYDHNYVLNGSYAAHAESRKTGIKLDLYTDMPCLQLYTGGGIKSVEGKSISYGQFAGFCLEAQYCPNAINMFGFDKPVLKAGENREHYILFKFECPL